MLNSLEIRNFRNLENLRIDSLGIVNLFTGKNNTGKSTLLEALGIYATKGDLALIYQLLDERGENYRQTSNTKSITELNVNALSSLFTSRKTNYSLDSAISIGAIDSTLFGKQRSSEQFVSTRFVRYYDETINDTDDDLNQPFRKKRTILNDDIDFSIIDYKIGLEVRTVSSSHIFQLDRERPYRLLLRNTNNQENFQLVRTRNIDREVNGKLWDSIALSEKEGYIIDALKIIEPTVERIAFIDEASKERTAVVKLKNSNTILPLKSMGDGINRVLTIILALVNSDNGFLLIDEFENGLHYTAQQKLWEIVFSLSQRLNVQVFATTHSQDCIVGFEYVLNNFFNSPLGKLIRLDNVNGKIKQVEFSALELKIATDQEIETR